VAVAAIMPTPRPLTTRATIRTGRDVLVRKSSAETISRLSAGMRIALRPSQSETWPASTRLITTPTAKAANTTVIANVENPSRAT
jgi:hypothetical protein